MPIAPARVSEILKGKWCYYIEREMVLQRWLHLAVESGTPFGVRGLHDTVLPGRACGVGGEGEVEWGGGWGTFGCGACGRCAGCVVEGGARDIAEGRGLPALTLDAGGIDGDPSAERGDPNDEKTDGEANEELLTPRFAPHDDGECELSGAWRAALAMRL